jgi:tetratricopeptide (TPR) repeat protein
MKKLLYMAGMGLFMLCIPALLISQTSYDYFQKGREAMDRKEYRAAADEFKKAIQLNSSYKEAHWNLAVCYFNLKEYRNAIASYGTAISYYSDAKDLATLYRWRGRSKEEAGDHDDAIRDYNTALSYDANNGDIYWDRGVVYFSFKNEYQKALEDYKKALSLLPFDKKDAATLYSHIGDCYLQLKKYDEAVANCTKSVEINPERRVAYWNRALANEGLKKYAEAIKDYTTAMQYYTDNENRAILYSNIGLNQKNLKQYDEAIQSYNKSIEYNPAYRNPYWNMAAAYYNKEDYQAAINWYSKAIEKYKGDFPSLADIYYWRAKSKNYNDDHTGALADLAKTLEYSPDYGDAYWERAYTYRQMLKYSKALAEYKNSMTWFQDNKENLAQLYDNAGDMESKLERQDNAISNYKKAIEIYPGNNEFYTDMGDAYLKKKDYSNAIVYYSKRIDRDTSKNPSPFTKAYRGYCYSKLNDKARAISDLTAACQWDEDIDTCFVYSFCKFALGEKQAAYDNLIHRIKSASKENIANRYVDLARLNALDNKESEVIKNLELALKAGYDDYDYLHTAWEFLPYKNVAAFKSLLVKYKVPVPE